MNIVKENNIFFENVLITGGSGMIGTNINFGIKPTSKDMDITDTHSIEKYINNIKNISCIIHLAATNVRESEEKPIKAINVNIDGTIEMLKIAKKYNIPFILLSTGAVFSSINYNLKFNENCLTCPNCVYGKTKSSSEKIALTYEKSIIIRTGWLFGGNQKNHYKFVENVIINFLTKNKIKASNDFFGSPTYVIDLIEKMKLLIINNEYGIHHIVNDGIANGYDIAFEISKILNINEILIESVNSNMIPNSGPKRSNSEILETIYTSNKLRNWKESLKEYVINYLNNRNFEIGKNINSFKNIIEDEMYEEIKNKKWINRDKCRMCNNYNLKTFFKLEPTPPANHFLNEKKYQEDIPLDICICDNCKHIQLLQIVEPEYQYSNYSYVSSTSNTMTNHLKNNINIFIKDLNLLKTDFILEIGANDGVCIKELLDNGFTNIIGIDPADNINKRHNLPIICDFFGSNILQLFKEKYNPFKPSKNSNGTFDIIDGKTSHIICNEAPIGHSITKIQQYKLIFGFHCCAHIENINDVFKTIYELLDDDGTFIMEVGYFYEVFNNYYFDTIYHEHIDYHTCTAIQKFSLQHNLVLYKVKENNIQGGSIQFYFCKNNNKKTIDNSVLLTLEKEKNVNLHNYDNLKLWKDKIILCGNDINYILNSFVSFGKKIAGYGASAKSTTFLHQYKLSNKIIEYIIDDNIYKQNCFSPGLHIPIKPIEYLKINKVDYILILSWNFTNEIVEKLNIYRELGIRIIIPFPEIKII